MGRLLIVIALCLIATNLVSAQQTGSLDPERYRLRERSRIGGLYLGTEVGNAIGALPFNKPFSALSTDEQNLVRSAYEKLGDNDEPPFPIGGLGAIYDPVARAQQRLLAEGDFYATVEVDESGKAMTVAVYKTPSAEVTKLVAAVLVLTKFKPARCEGAPCPMRFPVHIEFKLE